MIVKPSLDQQIPRRHATVPGNDCQIPNIDALRLRVMQLAESMTK